MDLQSSPLAVGDSLTATSVSLGLVGVVVSALRVRLPVAHAAAAIAIARGRASCDEVVVAKQRDPSCRPHGQRRLQSI